MMKEFDTKKLFLILVFALYGPVIQACEIYWYLAASLTKPGKEIVEKYNGQDSDCKLLLIIGGSGQLLSKINLSKIGDIYTPASKAFLDRATKKGIITRSILLLEQTPVFGLSKKGRKKIKTFNDLTKKNTKIALGNPKTMAIGRTYLSIESNMSLQLKDDIRRNKTVDSIHVNQTVNYLLKGIVEAGLIYDTTAKTNDIEYVAIPNHYNEKSQVYLATLRYTKDGSKTSRVVDFILDQNEIFKKQGFHLSENNHR